MIPILQISLLAATGLHRRQRVKAFFILEELQALILHRHAFLSYYLALQPLDMNWCKREGVARFPLAVGFTLFNPKETFDIQSTFTLGQASLPKAIPSILIRKKLCISVPDPNSYDSFIRLTPALDALQGKLSALR